MVLGVVSKTLCGLYFPQLCKFLNSVSFGLIGLLVWFTCFLYTFLVSSIIVFVACSGLFVSVALAQVSLKTIVKKIVVLEHC